MLFIPLVIVVIVLIVWFKQYEKSFFNKPKNYPDASKINRDDIVFIGFGDSLTQANMSADWLSILETKNKGIQFFNAGMNADLTYTLLDRIDDVIHCNPKFISLLVGSNDVMATMSPQRMKRYYDLGKITEDAHYEGFKLNYTSIVKALLNQTEAKIMVVSLPPITEDFTHPGNLKADKYSNTIKEIAEEYGLIYIPFREKLKSLMPFKSNQVDDFDNSVMLIMKAGLKKNFLGQSWNEIAQSRHAKYLTDNIHLNTDAAEILAKMIENEIKQII